MGVGDDEFDAPQAPAGQLAQERRPDWFSLRGADLHAEHFPPAVVIDAGGDDDGNRDDVPATAHLQIEPAPAKAGVASIHR